MPTVFSKIRPHLDTINVLLILIGLSALTLGSWRPFRKPHPDPVTFQVPDSGFSVRFPAGEPVEEDLTLFLIDPDGPDVDERTGNIRRFQAEVGTIRARMTTDGKTRHGVRVHAMAPKFIEQAKAQMVALLDSDNEVGSAVTNLPVLVEARGMVNDRSGRLVLAERRDGRRILVVIFPADNHWVFLFVERPGTDLTAADPTARAFFKSVEFIPK